jgi:uncharacterized protein (TIGR00369 family)
MEADVALMEIVTRLREAGDFDQLMDAIPYARFLDLEVVVAGSELTTRMRFHDELIGNPVLPALHGGTVGSLLESAAIFQLMWDETVSALPRTINFTVDYLRSARAVDTFARAFITKQGRRVANVHVEAWQQVRERPIATADAHFLLSSSS